MIITIDMKYSFFLILPFLILQYMTFHNLIIIVNNFYCSSYLVCRDFKKRNCAGRGKLDRHGHFSETQGHNHEIDDTAQDISTLKIELFNAVKTQPAKNKTIYNRIQQL